MKEAWNFLAKVFVIWIYWER